MSRQTLYSVALLMAMSVSLPSGAQESESAPAPAPAPAAVPVNSVNVEDAYRKEFAFLTAQKRELSQQIQTAKTQGERARNQLTGEVASLQARVIAAENGAERLASDLNVADQATLSNQENSELLLATLGQAQITLEGFGVDLNDDPAYADSDDAGKLLALDQQAFFDSGVDAAGYCRDDAGCRK